MKFYALAMRNFKETMLDVLSLGLLLVLPPAMLLLIMNLGRGDDLGVLEFMVPGSVVLGFSFMSLSVGMLMTKDRDKAFLSRLFTAPLRARDFVLAYSVPFIPIILIQLIIVYGVAAGFGMAISANIWLVALILFIMAIGYIGLGLILGTTCTFKNVSAAWVIISVLTMFGGAWVSMETFGSGIQAVSNFLPFTHALNGARAVAVDGAGFSDIAMDLVWVAGWSAVFVIAGVYLFKKKMTE